MTNLPPPVTPGYSPLPPQVDWTPPSPKGPKLPWILGAAAILITVLVVAGGIALLGQRAGQPTASTSSTVADDPAAQVVETAPAPAPAYTPKISDFELTAKITEKQCFGSAGCSVTFEPDLAYGGPSLDEDVTWRIIYQATGIQDGPLIGSIEVTGKDYESQSEFVDTKSTKSKITLKVTSIEKN